MDDPAIQPWLLAIWSMDCSVSTAVLGRAEWWQSPVCSRPAPWKKGQWNSKNNSAEWPWLPGAEPHSSQGEPGFPWLHFHMGREAVLWGIQTILRPDSKGTYEVTESRFGCRTLIGILNLSLALGHYHWDMPCFSLPIL